MELFEQIRRDREFEGLSLRALAEKYRVHRRTVRQALESSVPPARKPPVGRPAPRLGEWRALIDDWLEADRTAPRKQRHTAKRIFERLRDEHGVEVSERQVRRYVRERRQQVGELVDEVFVPLCAEPGAEAEVDWGEATVVIAGVPRTVHLFLMRSCFSGACFVQAQLRETQQAFLEGHVAGFAFFEGVFGVVRYDNLKSAVVRVLKGRRRVESDRFVAMRSQVPAIGAIDAANRGTAAHSASRVGISTGVERRRQAATLNTPARCNGRVRARDQRHAGRAARRARGRDAEPGEGEPPSDGRGRSVLTEGCSR